MSNICVPQQHTTVTDLCWLFLYLCYRFCRQFAFSPERGRTVVGKCTPPEQEDSASGSLTPISLLQMNSRLSVLISELWPWYVIRATQESCSGPQIRTHQTLYTTRYDNLLGKALIWYDEWRKGKWRSKGNGNENVIEYKTQILCLYSNQILSCV
jgi:hypothetical protein